MSFCNVQFKVKKMITIRKRSYGKEMLWQVSVILFGGGYLWSLVPS